MASIETPVAFVVAQVNVVDWETVIVAGFTVREAVGASGAAGSGGAGGLVALEGDEPPHPVRVIDSRRVIKTIDFI